MYNPVTGTEISFQTFNSFTIMAENSNVYVGYTESPRVTQRISFTLEELDTMKQYATQKGRVYVDVVSIPDREDNRRMKAFCSVYDPNSQAGRHAKTSHRAASCSGFGAL